MKADWKKKVIIDPEIMGGKPVIKGTRVPVEVIVGGLAGGMTIEEVCDEYRSQSRRRKGGSCLCSRNSF